MQELLTGKTRPSSRRSTLERRPEAMGLLNLVQSASPSVANLPLVTDGQDHCRLTVIAVQCDIAAVTEVDHPLAVLGLHVLNRSADAGLVREHFTPSRMPLTARLAASVFFSARKQ